MTHDEFLKKWHQPTDSIVVHLQISMSPKVSVGNTTLKLECHLRYPGSAFPIIRESVVSKPILDRSVDDIAKSLFDELDEVLALHLERFKQLKYRPAQTKPIVVVLVGAGFSAGFGFPTMARLKCYVGKLAEKPNFGIFNDAPNLFDEARDCYPLNEYLKNDGAIKDFEYLLTVWEGYRSQMGAYDKNRKVAHEQYYRGVIENVCCHLYSLSCDILSCESKRARLDAFVSWLKEAKQDFDVRFVTFNYDIVLEQAI